MKNKNIIAVIAIVAIVIAGIIISNKPKAKESESNEQIVIGAVLSLTGMASADGESIRDGIELAKSELLAEGVDVVVNYYDDATDTKQTVGNIQLAKTASVDAIIGPTWSFLGDAAAPVCEQIEIVCYEPANTSEYTSKGKNVFFGTTPVRLIADPLSGLLKENSIISVAEFHNLGGWGDTNSLATNSAAKLSGAKVEITEKVDFGQEVAVMDTFLTKVKKLNIKTVVTSIDDDKALFALIKKSKQYGVETIIAETTSVVRVMRAQGISASEYGIAVYTVVPQNNRDFIERYQQKYNKTAGPYADTAYDGMKMLVYGIRNKTEGEHLRDYLKRFPYTGLAKTYAFDQNNDVSGGQWEVVQEK
jgi:branched-chain amino acid transport system substrate-binding protein